MVINSQRQNAGAAQVKPAALKRSLDVELVLSPSLPLSLSLSLSFCNSQIFLKWIKFYVYFFLSSIFPSLIIYFACFRKLCFSFLLLLRFSNIIVVPSCKQNALWDILLPIRRRRALETNFPIGQLIAFSAQAKSWLNKLKFRLQLSVDIVVVFCYEP